MTNKVWIVTEQNNSDNSIIAVVAFSNRDAAEKLVTKLVTGPHKDRHTTSLHERRVYEKTD